MKKISLLLALILVAKTSFAQDLEPEVKDLQEAWTAAKYQSKNKDEIVAGLEKCAAKAAEVENLYPQSANPVIWHGICLASQGEYLKMTALPKVKEAKKLFEKALTINPKALDGSAYTNLGVLYHRVPGWPIGFGDKKKAEENFKKALEIAPQNIDANYFYGAFLLSQDRLDEAKKYLEIAANAPGRNRPLADQKRREEIKAALDKIQ
jgi:tetratricopeptide (TPR) repeat protein